MLPINVLRVLAVTSSITSSSSPVLLFATNHSNTSSSLFNSSVIEQIFMIDYIERSVTKLTFVYDWNLMPVIHQFRKCSKIVFLGESFVRNFDKSNAQLISLVIDIFQLLQSLRALFAFRLIYWMKEQKYQINKSNLCFHCAICTQKILKKKKTSFVYSYSDYWSFRKRKRKKTNDTTI